VPQRAAGYVDRDGTLVNGEPLRPRIIAPNGGILSSAPDMGRWLDALFAGRIVKPDTLALMTRPITLNDRKSFSAGFAWFLDTFRGRRVLLHNGSTIAGFSSVVYWYPDHALGVVVLMNIDRWNAVNVLATKMANCFVAGLSTGELTPVSDPDPALSRRLLDLLGAIAGRRDSEALAPNLRNPNNPPRVPASFGFAGVADRFTLLEREDLGGAGVLRFGQTIRWIHRYRLVSGSRVICYTFELTPQGEVARMFPEEE
jgi:CubicO group peptidase (beta-lactamase class C family)